MYQTRLSRMKTLRKIFPQNWSSYGRENWIGSFVLYIENTKIEKATFECNTQSQTYLISIQPFTIHEYINVSLLSKWRLQAFILYPQYVKFIFMAIAQTTLLTKVGQTEKCWSGLQQQSIPIVFVEFSKHVKNKSSVISELLSRGPIPQ